MIAAVLHDVLEHTPTAADEVTARFGARVCRLVESAVGRQGATPSAASRITLEELPSAETDVKVIKLADVSSNIKLMPPTWSDERKLEYLEWSERAATICSPECPALADLHWHRARATRAALDVMRWA